MGYPSNLSWQWYSSTWSLFLSIHGLITFLLASLLFFSFFWLGMGVPMILSYAFKLKFLSFFVKHGNIWTWERHHHMVLILTCRANRQVTKQSNKRRVQPWFWPCIVIVGPTIWLVSNFAPSSCMCAKCVSSYPH